MFKQAFAALALTSALAAAHSEVLLSEGFENIAKLQSSGWVLKNASTPAGTSGWGQGGGVFTAQAGSDESYISGNYNNAAAGGQISNWLITPTFSTAKNVQVTFWVRGDDSVGYFDQFSFGLSNGGSNISDFSIGEVFTAPVDGWTEFAVNVGAQGAGSVGRFAIQYTGIADSANFMGIDTLAVTVPEPSSVALLFASFGALALSRKRKAG
ncbi:choice-of-anchor J family PEP-CTERM protein [Roseateles koreensis]|uniref:Choice-of-anchor J domain-containing protein n=1 Tax=Roseateles koreensis TaxID=2987526 RepID=A0ABT5KS02_9BURK|nr:choice-of-anchor J domain-containing protein [Roseateles koreensis]MDC8785713.1 choice-of-anchor J domain-containing protein [Roseateles koreensis]